MPYSLDDLRIKGDTEQEQSRVRLIFEDLQSKCQNEETLTEDEKQFFCELVSISKLDDGKLEDYNCCDNYKFKECLLDYFNDVLGFSNYTKPRGQNVYTPTRTEIIQDIEYLRKVATNWNSVIEKTNHSDELLQQVCKETRSDIKKLNAKKGKLLFQRQKINHKRNLRSLILRSKYLYLHAKKVFENFDSSEFIIELNGQLIEINEFSIVHILNRHFAGILIPHSDKDFHNIQIDHNLLNKQIGYIITRIDNSDLFVCQSIEKINFIFKRIIYTICTHKRTKSIKGNGNVEYNRLETFYPVKREVDIEELNQNYSLMEIDGELSVYIKK